MQNKSQQVPKDSSAVGNVGEVKPYLEELETQNDEVGHLMGEASTQEEENRVVRKLDMMLVNAFRSTRNGKY